MALPDLGGVTGFGGGVSGGPKIPASVSGSIPNFGPTITGYPTAITRPGFTPDYKSLIENDAGLAALRASLSGSDIANASARAAATNRALVQFGYVPDFAGSAAKLGLSADQLGYLAQDVTPDVTANATANTTAGLSTEAKLAQAHTQAVTQIRNALAARGALSSGEAPYELNNEQTSYGQAQSDATGSLLDAITGYQNSYLQGKQAAAAQLAAAQATAEQTQMGLPQNQPTSATTFHYDAATGKYTGGGKTYTPHAFGNGFVVVDDATGQAYMLNSDGTIGGETSYTPNDRGGPAGASPPGPSAPAPTAPPPAPPAAPAPRLPSSAGASGAAGVKSGQTKVNYQARRNSLL